MAQMTVDICSDITASLYAKGQGLLGKKAKLSIWPFFTESLNNIVFQLLKMQKIVIP